MKIKNIVLVLVAALLVLLHPGTVEASSTGGGSSIELPFRCSCGGNYLEYYNVPNIYRWRSITHSIYNSEMYNNCSLVDFGRSANGDNCYFVKLFAGSDLFDYYSFVIYISDDNIIELYDNFGSVINRNKSDFNSGINWGESNGKYFGFIGNVEGYGSSFTHHYDDGYNFSITVPSYSTSKIIELARFLCGEISELPDGYEIIQPEAIYDLEPPLNVSVNGIDNNIFETKSKSVKIRWEQSNIDLTGYKTVFYMRESGRCRKTIFNEWQDVKTPWLFDKDYVTAKYCNNNLKYHEYKWWTDQSKLGDYANAALYGEETGGLMCEHAAVDFMIRNEKEDEDGTLHYSSWVYVNCFEDGTYQIYEMNEDYTLDKDPDETGNINTDSTIYDDETIYDEDDVDASLGIGDAKDFVGGMTELINSLRSFPALFSKIFSFFPSWVLGMIGMLFIAALVSRIFL